ncbi:TcmI family type II polyketide cyclase [Streptomyces radicis]|uniref:TcmI family type II polyketide cyclase n=1 Tax=Streptomyces radicis TaxID=1750517 RepID=A0A3A9WDY5_9ACTN|nr:TcmI family type II polyketide cyclase [Streptomyces radicis]RKN11541.1 TcmI family type II polyketide cyclase [Streptomyces radicis]RKN26441.1 TcmI family type II polyketide cyclase [Streptomyces radicis]
MYSTLIVARMKPGAADDIARVFAEFDATEMPSRMGTRRRELFTYQGLYFHLQDFDTENGPRNIDEARSHPLFVKVSADMRPFVDPYDPDTWRSPADAMATRFYRWRG